VSNANLDKVDDGIPPMTVPYAFDTTQVWHSIVMGALGLNAILIVGVIVKLASRTWLDAVGVTVIEAVVAGFTAFLVRHQDGSKGTLFPDRVVVEGNRLLGVPLPGPHGAYALKQFRGVRIQYWPGPVSASPNSGGPHEVIWLVGAPGTPDIAVARTRQRTGERFGRDLAALLSLPVEETGMPIQITL